MLFRFVFIFMLNCIFPFLLEKKYFNSCYMYITKHLLYNELKYYVMNAVTLVVTVSDIQLLSYTCT